MFIDNFNKIIISELKYVLSEIPEEDRNVENLIEKFSEHISSGEGTTKKAKRVAKPKELLAAAVRCHALKKDGVQCNGKKNNKENPEIMICALHQRMGVKFGYLQETSEASDNETPEIDDEEPSSSKAVPKVASPPVKKVAVKRTKKEKTPEVVVAVEETESVQDELDNLANIISKHSGANDNEEDDFE